MLTLKFGSFISLQKLTYLYNELLIQRDAIREGIAKLKSTDSDFDLRCTEVTRELEYNEESIRAVEAWIKEKKEKEN